MGLFKKIFAPVVQYYEKIKAEEEERKRREDLRKQRIAYIKTNGKYISAVRNLNNSIGFKNIESHPRFKRTCNSKTQLDNFNIDNTINTTISNQIEGRICSNCRDVIETEIGNNIFYLTSLCNCLDLNLYDIILKEESKINVLGKYNLR